jgi:phosphatidylserine/phosphatidylglycerophosphate/cardiolipin synthase-like enzyme
MSGSSQIRPRLAGTRTGSSRWPADLDDDQARIAHAKTMVIDGAVTLMGSMNWTRRVTANSEDLNLVSFPAVAAAYAAHWPQRLAVSARFDRREDRCRASSAAVR